MLIRSLYHKRSSQLSCALVYGCYIGWLMYLIYPYCSDFWILTTLWHYDALIYVCFYSGWLSHMIPSQSIYFRVYLYMHNLRHDIYVPNCVAYISYFRNICLLVTPLQNTQHINYGHYCENSWKQYTGYKMISLSRHVSFSYVSYICLKTTTRNIFSVMSQHNIFWLIQ